MAQKQEEAVLGLSPWFLMLYIALGILNILQK